MSEPMRLLLDWKLDAKHAIFVEGRDSGVYSTRGIGLELVEPAAKSITALEILHDGGAELAINYPHNLMLSRAQLPELLSVGALVRRNPEGLLSLATRPVRSPGELKGRTVGIGPSPVSRAQFEVFCRSNGLPMESLRVVTVGFDGEELLLAGEIDALDGVAYAIARTRRKGHDVAFVPYADFGIPDSPFLVFCVRRDWAQRNGETLRAFLEASTGAFERVCEWEELDWDRYAARIPGRDGEEERLVWKATEPLIRVGGRRLFEQDLPALEGLHEILCSEGLLEEHLNLRDVFTNRFVPE
jgi:putative hydroxymethylpyrimidine transport system substrate-binding protein